MKNAKKSVKIGEKKAKQAKQQAKVIPNRDFLERSAQNIYVTDNSIVTQRVLALDKSGKPVSVRNEYYARTKGREKAMKDAGITPGKPIKGRASGKQTVFWR